MEPLIVEVHPQRFITKEDAMDRQPSPDQYVSTIVEDEVVVIARVPGLGYLIFRHRIYMHSEDTGMSILTDAEVETGHLHCE